MLHILHVLQINFDLNLYISVAARSMFNSVVHLHKHYSFPESFVHEFFVQYFENLTALEYMYFSLIAVHFI